jgi:hypothetical protein
MKKQSPRISLLLVLVSFPFPVSHLLFPDVLVCEIAVHAESCMLLSNYFDCCAGQFNARSQIPTKDSLQKCFKLFQSSMLPVVDYPSLSMFEYVYGRANSHYPMKFEGKIQKEELASDIYSFSMS